MKKTRAMCRAIAPTNTSAAQWWVWRISSPPLTSKEMRSTESYAAETSTPRNGAYEPSYTEDLLRALEEQRQVDPGDQHGTTKLYRAISPHRNEKWLGNTLCSTLPTKDSPPTRAVTAST